MPTTKTVNILLVDDDEVDVEAIKRAFRRQKIANPVYHALDGAVALEMLRGTPDSEPIPEPRMILLDLNMPRMGGLEFLEELRQDEKLKSNVVIVLTTSNDDRDKTAAYEKQIAGYVIKDSVGDDFVKLIEMLDAYWRIVELPVIDSRKV